MHKRRIVALLFLFCLLLAGCGSPIVKQDAANYVGSIKSDKYHYPDCRWAESIKLENEIWFSSTGEAEEQGYVPCKTCQP